METRPISPGFVADALECLSRAGIARGPVLKRVGLSEDMHAPLTAAQYGALWQEIARVAQDEFFGLAARPMRPGSFIMMSHACIGSPTLAVALRRAVDFLGIVLDDPRGSVHVVDQQVTVILDDSQAPRPAFAYRTYWLMLMGLCCWLVGRRLPLQRVDFACSPPRDRPEYLTFFGATVRFDQPHTAISFDATYLRLPVIRDQRALKRFLKNAPANILTAYRQHDGLAMRIRKTLDGVPLGEWPTFEALAGRMRLSPATLRRHLRSEGQSFGSIRDERRRLVAQRLLHDGQMQIADIATELGYSEPSAFYRAFRKWTGTSPAAHRSRR